MAKRKFTLFHLSLLPRREPELGVADLDREGWLRRCLSERFTFQHWGGRSFFWVPQEGVDSYVVGVMEEERKRTQHVSPREGGEEFQGTEWQGAYLLLDPTSHEDGQKIAIENDIVGRPSALLNSMLSRLNSLPEAPFEILYEQIFDGKNFWKFAENNNYLLRSIVFDFVVPNMWNAEGGLEKDLKEAAEDGTENVSVQFKSERGIDAGSAKIRSGVSYAERGGGSLRAQATNGKKFSSKDRPTVTEAPERLDDGSGPLGVVREFREKLLGR